MRGNEGRCQSDCALEARDGAFDVTILFGELGCGIVRERIGRIERQRLRYVLTRGRGVAASFRARRQQQMGIGPARDSSGTRETPRLVSRRRDVARGKSRARVSKRAFAHDTESASGARSSSAAT